MRIADLLIGRTCALLTDCGVGYSKGKVIEEVEIFNRDSISSLMQECNEILSIVVSSINTARKRK